MRDVTVSRKEEVVPKFWGLTFNLEEHCGLKIYILKPEFLMMKH